MVAKPLEFVMRDKRGLVQPAVKCRGREYLRIINGPDYDAPENLERLRNRGLGPKRSLAQREFALGIEALERFVRKNPSAASTNTSSACWSSKANPSICAYKLGAFKLLSGARSLYPDNREMR